LENILEKFQVSLKYYRSSGYFTWRPVYIFDHISLSSSYSEKCCGQTLYKKSKRAFYAQ
jgi:hypothetical protein